MAYTQENGQGFLEADDDGLIRFGALYETSSSSCPIVGLPAENLLALLPTPTAGFAWKIFTETIYSDEGKEYISAYFAEVEIDQTR